MMSALKGGLRIAFVVLSLSILTTFSKTTISAQADKSPIASLDWSPDGMHIVIGRDDGRLEIVDTVTKEIRQLFEQSNITVNSVAWNPIKESKIAVAQSFGIIGIIDIVAPQETIFFDLGWIRSVYAISWSPDGSKLAGAVLRHLYPDESPNVVMIWDGTTGEVITTLQKHLEEVLTVAWSPDGTRIISGSADGSAIIWDANTGFPLVTLKPVDGIDSTLWNPDSTQVVTVSNHGYPSESTIQIWDAASGQLLATYPSQYVFDIAWSPCSSSIVIANGENLQILDPATGEVSDIIQQAGDITVVAWSPNGDALGLGGSNGEMQIVPVFTPPCDNSKNCALVGT